MSINGPKKSRGRPAVDSEAVKLRVGRAVLDRVDAYAKRREISRTETIRQWVGAMADYVVQMDEGLDPIVVGLTLAEKQLVDQWASSQPDAPSRPEAVRRLVAQSLRRVTND